MNKKQIFLEGHSDQTVVHKVEKIIAITQKAFIIFILFFCSYNNCYKLKTVGAGPYCYEVF